MPLTELDPIKVLQTSMLKDNGPQTDNIYGSKIKVHVRANIVRRLELEKILGINYDIENKILEERKSFHTSHGIFDLFGYFCSLQINR